MAAPAWVIAFLNEPNALNTPPNQLFLERWDTYAPGTCRNNHIDLTQAVSGSTRCGDTVGPFGRSQNYPTVADAARAFNIQLGASWVKPLRDAINSGNPFQIADKAPVVAVLNRWGSTTFASWYATATAQGGTGGGGGGGAKADLLRGWHTIQTALNHDWHRDLNAGERSLRLALRSLGGSRKVKH